MSEITDVEQRIRAEDQEAFSGASFVPQSSASLIGDRRMLLRLLDAERARADAAEAKVADIRLAYVNWQSSDDTPELLDACSRLAPTIK